MMSGAGPSEPEGGPGAADDVRSEETTSSSYSLQREIPGHLRIDDALYETSLPEWFPREFHGLPDPGTVRAFIPGVIVSVRVSPGQRVSEGETLLVLEAMKMQNEVITETGGTVSSVEVEPGQRVEKNQLLVTLT